MGRKFMKAFSWTDVHFCQKNMRGQKSSFVDGSHSVSRNYFYPHVIHGQKCNLCPHLLCRQKYFFYPRVLNMGIFTDATSKCVGRRFADGLLPTLVAHTKKRRQKIWPCIYKNLSTFLCKQRQRFL